MELRDNIWETELKVKLEEVAMAEVPAPKRMSVEVKAVLPVPPWETPAVPVEVRFLPASVKTRLLAVRVAMLMLPREVIWNKVLLEEEATVKMGVVARVEEPSTVSKAVGEVEFKER